MGKGVSPLVAAVLMIAITMTIAAMLSYWASGFVKSRTEEWEKQLPAGDCTFANFRVYTCRYDAASSSLIVILENVKAVDLTNITATVIYSNGTIDSRSGLANLGKNKIQTYTLAGIDPNYENLVVKTHCSDITSSDDCR